MTRKRRVQFGIVIVDCFHQFILCRTPNGSNFIIMKFKGTSVPFCYRAAALESVSELIMLAIFEISRPQLKMGGFIIYNFKINK